MTDDLERRLSLGVFEGATPMRMHRQRRRFLRSRKRFAIIPAGRRSGKTVEARHRLLFGSKHFGGNHHGCLTPPTDVADPTFVYGAPTYAQAKRIVWERFKAEIPKWAIRQKSESELWIRFVTGAILYVVGMDRPERAEGIPIDGLVLDEFADMKPSAWYSSTRPTLSTPGRPPGWALFIGRPRGMGHFGKLFKDAQDPKNVPDWDVFYPWPSWLVMDPNEVAAARRDLDERSFRQEYGGEFLDDIGRAYYQFGPWNLRDVAYNPSRPLQFAFDFNVNPGVAVVAQDLDQVVELLVCYRCSAPMPGKSGEPCRFCSARLPFETVTGVIDEVFRWQITSNTRLVCEDLIREWGPVHRGGVICYGDPSGGARHTSSERSDWQTIEDYLSRQWPVFEMDLPSADPGIRDRLVVTNSRLKNASDQVRIYIDPVKAPHLVEDLENTQLKPNGDIDEGPDRKNSHMCLASGTMVAAEHGDVPIEDVRPGLRVWTRKGLRTVTAQWCSGEDAQLYRISTECGRELLATATHPILIGRGWIPAADVRQGDPVLVLAESPSSLEASPSTGTQTRSAELTGSTSILPVPTAAVVLRGSTVRSGNPRTDPSRQGTTSTTSMGTQTTTRSTTLRSSAHRFTSESTASNASSPESTTACQNSPGCEPPSGMVQPRGNAGTQSMGAGPGKGEILSTTPSARSAGKSSRATLQPAEMIGSAQVAARQSTASAQGSMTSTSCALSAELRSVETDTAPARRVVDGAVRSCSTESGLRGTVWDLTVDDAHEFFASGILVSNSDALAYQQHQRFGSPVNSRSKEFAVTSI